MPVTENPVHAREPISDREQKMMALGYLHEAWAEARHDGIDGDCLAQACLFAALAELVTTYGEEAAATFTDGLSSSSRGNNGSTIFQLASVSRNLTRSPWAGVASAPCHITLRPRTKVPTGQPVTLTPS